MYGFTLTDEHLRLTWAGAKHYRNVAADLGDDVKKKTADDLMKLCESEASNRSLDLWGRKGYDNDALRN